MMMQKVISQPFRPHLQKILVEGVMGTCGSDDQTWYSQRKYGRIAKIQLTMSMELIQDHVMGDAACSGKAMGRFVEGGIRITHQSSIGVAIGLSFFDQYSMIFLDMLSLNLCL